MDNRNTSTELSNRIATHIRELAAATNAARLSAEMQRYLEMCARFHRYSPHNVWLILTSRPSATQVAGFRNWLSQGRFVLKGEKGIPILAPIFIKEADEAEGLRLAGFKVVYVFDIKQTGGQPLREPPDWKSPEQSGWLQEQLIRFAESRGIQIEIGELAGETQGVSRGGAIQLSADAGTKTLIHELAHEMMHQGKDRSSNRTILELEAESVAYVVARHFGLDGLSSPNYIALHGADADMILAHLDRIRKTAAEIISAGEQQEVEPMPE